MAGHQNATYVPHKGDSIIFGVQEHPYMLSICYTEPHGPGKPFSHIGASLHRARAVKVL